MTIELAYSTVLNGASFMLNEFKQVVKLKERGLTDQEIRQKVITENLFQYEKASSVKRALTSVLRRVNALDQELRQFVLTASYEDTKVMNLYAIMKTDRLFFEFMQEVIEDKFQTNDYNFGKTELNLFFTIKAEQNEKIANWSPVTIQKLKREYRKILVETGLIESRNAETLHRITIDEQVKSHLKLIGDHAYVQVMGA